jgi:hypothetical protein
MGFEWDKAKSKANFMKHGIDFDTAKVLWEISHLEIPARNVDGEIRRALIAKLNGKYWLAVFTIRDDEIRIISVRTARDDERRAYEKYSSKS